MKNNPNFLDIKSLMKKHKTCGDFLKVWNSEINKLVDEFADYDPYVLEDEFITVHDYIFTFQNDIEIFDNNFHSQFGLVELVSHKIDSLPYEIDLNIVQTAINELDNLMKMNLVKVSSATHFLDNLRPREMDLVERAITRQSKWYFQPDQRDAIENFLVKNDPCIARNVIPYQEMVSGLSNHINDLEDE